MESTDSLWDFDDPEGSEGRFRASLEAHSDEGIRLELLTQIARTHSMRRQFESAHALLDDVEQELRSASDRTRVRYLLERGRTFNSSGFKADALALFHEAFELGLKSSEHVLAADAAHMISIAETGDEAIRWNLITLEMAESSDIPGVRKWRGSVLNNLGWSYYDLGQFEHALACFRRAVEVRAEVGGMPLLIARYCVGKCLRAMGQAAEGLAIQLELEAEHGEAGTGGGYVFEEIAECLLALGQPDDSAPYFRRAYEALSGDIHLTANEPARLARLAELGASGVSLADDR